MQSLQINKHVKVKRDPNIKLELNTQYLIDKIKQLDITKIRKS